MLTAGGWAGDAPQLPLDRRQGERDRAWKSLQVAGDGPRFGVNSVDHKPLNMGLWVRENDH